MSKKHELNDYTVKAGKNIQLGQGGYYVSKTGLEAINSTNIANMKDTDHIIAVTGLVNTKITIVAGNIHDDEDPADILIPNGTTVYGKWTAIVLTRAAIGEEDPLAQGIFYFG